MGSRVNAELFQSLIALLVSYILSMHLAQKVSQTQWVASLSDFLKLNFSLRGVALGKN